MVYMDVPRGMTAFDVDSALDAVAEHPWSELREALAEAVEEDDVRRAEVVARAVDLKLLRERAAVAAALS